MFINSLDNENDYQVQNDLNWVNKNNLDSDSEFNGNNEWAVSISEAAISDLLNFELEDKKVNSKVGERRNEEGGTKRKAAVNTGEELDEGEEGAEEFKAHQILSGAKAFLKRKFSNVSSNWVIFQDDTYQ